MGSACGDGAMKQGMDLWCAVYDGPLIWEGRDAFEQIDYLFEMLARYGEHDEDCGAVDHDKLAILSHLCTCGLANIGRLKT